MFLAANHCKVSFSPPYAPELNGLAVWGNRTIWESAYSMWLQIALPAMFWTFTILYATIIANYCLTTTLRGKMAPLHAKFGVVPNGDIFE